VRPSESAWLAILQSIAAGDQLALRELYGRMHHLVFTLIMRIVQNRQTAEELTLDVFHDVWERAGSYEEGTGSVVGWVMNQARSRAIDQTRFERRKKRVNPFPDEDAEVSANLPEALLNASQHEQQIRCALTYLTPPEQRVIELAFFADCTYAEVALRLDEPAGTVKTRIRSALKKLRVVLENRPAQDDLAQP
jgi:RNA polymerase sigma-70 factor (ECF subfamily)